MKAIQVTELGGPEVLRLAEVSDPQPGPGQVRVRVGAAGVNPVETYIRSGKHAIKPPLPYTPGTDAAGTVDALGEGVTGLKVGDRVYTAGSVTGAYAERVVSPAEQVHPLPEALSFSQGAAIYVPYFTAYRALLQKARAVAGEVVLVHGASGGVGTAAVQLAAAAGLTVIGTAGTERGRELVRQQGAHHVLDHHDPTYLEQARALTGGRGVDLILEMLANENLEKDLTTLAPWGRVVVIGNRGTVEINPRHLMGLDACVMGVMLFNTPPKELKSIQAGLYAGFSNGTLRPVVGQEIPLAEAPRAHEAVLAPGAFGKIVLVP